jgi:malate dehydrogenase (oxaloacetate-decarboxylating)
MKLAAAKAIAACVSEDELAFDHIVPSVFDVRVAPRVAEGVARAAIDEGVVRMHRPAQP